MITYDNDINSYNLPVCDVQSERRNFPGTTEAQYFTLVDIVEGDTAGTTETDSKTAPSSPGYTRINKTSGPGSKWNRNG